MSSLVGIVTFGNLEFTRLAVDSVLETAGRYITNRNIVLVVGKPGDQATADYAARLNIPHIVHAENYGFPYSLNDIYDFAWKANNYDNVIIMGNDVIALPHSINSMIEIARTTDYEWVCGREVSVKNLTQDYPETHKYFSGDNFIFNDFTSRPWDALSNKFSTDISEAGLSDVHNMSLFKKSVMEKIGYIDVNFYPAYFEDNDYARRAVLAGIKSCTAINGIYFHFWSRTIKQGSGGSTSKYFQANSKFYRTKWGGEFLSEAYSSPFNGKERVQGGVTLLPDINIQDRESEKLIVKYWKR